MPYQKLIYLPGYYTEGSNIDSFNRYIFGNHVRFFKGFPKKIGGSVRSGVDSFLGICRGIEPWSTLSDIKYTAIGTNLKLYIDEGGTLFDITPIRLTTTAGTNPITTTMGSTIITVHDVANGANINDFVTISGATAVGGITPNGNFQIASIIDADNYTVDTHMIATSGAVGGGTVVMLAYEIHVGNADTQPLGGWGAGFWGQGTWGTPRDNSGFINFARTWSGNNYGEDLIYSPRDGAIYLWTASTGVSVRAAVISEAPATNKYVLVSPEDRYIISMGSNDGVDSDPMLIRWSSQNDFTDWTPTSINTAGDKRLSDGNLIICAVITRGSTIISTDTTVYQMYADTTFVFAFKALGVGGCISPNGMIEFNGVVYWMGSNNFYSYDGNINIINCDVRSYVFDNLNTLQSYKVYAWVNSAWNEIWWFYADNTSNECNRYVAYDYVENTWHFGSRNMTAAHDRSVVQPTPISTGSNGNIYSLESGVDEDGIPMDTLLQTGSQQIGQHNNYALVKKILPNFKTLVGTTTMAVQIRLYPQDPNPVTTTPYTVTASTILFSPRIRGDEFSLIYQNSVLGSDFYMGTPEAQIIATGAR